MEKLKGYQKKYLKSMAHDKKPLVFIGSKGVTKALIKAVDEALDTHELIKIKFIDFKEKDQKDEISLILEEETNSERVGLIGHIAIFYREQRDPKKRKVIIPKR